MMSNMLLPSASHATAPARRRLTTWLGEDRVAWEAFVLALTVLPLARLLAVQDVDFDYWWHIATGWWILDHHRIPTVDPFSTTLGGHNWYASEWLADVFLGAASRSAGYYGALLLTVAFITVAIWLLMRAAHYYGASPLLLVPALAIGEYYLGMNIVVRPVVWSWALLALLMHELIAHDTGRRRQLWHLPLLFAIWVNVNLSVFLGGIVLALYVLHHSLGWTIQRRTESGAWKRPLHLLVVGLLSAGAILLNPHGARQIGEAIAYSNPHAFRHQNIQEWESSLIYFRRPGTMAFVVLGATGVVLFLLVLAMLRRRRLWPGAPVLVLALLSVSAVRFLPLFALVLIPSGGWLLSSMTSWRPATARRNTRSGPILLATIAAMAIPLLWASPSAVRDPGRDQPVREAQWVQAHYPDGPIFNDYNNGGYLISAFYPARRVYVDGREDLYGDQFLLRYGDLIYAHAGWQDTLAAQGLTVAVLANDRALARAMDTDPDWRAAFVGPRFTVFVAREPGGN